MVIAMTTHPVERASENEAIARLRQRAWQVYLESTRDSEEYETAELEAWTRLQDRLAEIDQSLLLADRG
jgi:hypothetical protein